jgi:hypothetical protein
MFTIFATNLKQINMKKLLLSISALLLTGVVSAQETTLTQHFAPAFAAQQFGVYNWGNDAEGNFLGYVSGNNAYGDKAIVQKFDAGYGVGSSSTVTGLNAWVPAKLDGGGSISLAIYADNAGAPGAILAQVAVNLADVDTTLAGLQTVTVDGVVETAYNVSVTFSSPVVVADQTFWAGVILPTVENVAIVFTSTMSEDAGAWSFAQGSTHAGVIESDDSFLSHAEATNNQLLISNAIFPRITNATAGIENNIEFIATAYPNPATDVLNVKVDGEEVVSIQLIAMDGKVVSTTESATANVAELTAGMYIYEATTASGAVIRNTFVKK